MSPTRPRHNGTNAALRTAAKAVAAANCEDPSVLKAVLTRKAAAATAKALADSRPGHSPTGSPTRRTATPDSEGEAQSPAP
jgi:hypothetical protein